MENAGPIICFFISCLHILSIEPKHFSGKNTKTVLSQEVLWASNEVSQFRGRGVSMFQGFWLEVRGPGFRVFWGLGVRTG